MDQASLGSQIRQIRQSFGLSQVQLAALLGVSNVTVNRWEHDRGVPEPATLARIRLAERDGIAAFADAQQRIGNLPIIPDPIVGRSADLERIEHLILHHRIVTITGTAGVGKTRVATEVGERLAKRFDGGVWFVDLASISHDDSVAQAIARALGVRENSRRSIEDRLISDVWSRDILVILDNCEHVLADSKRVAAELLAAPGAARLVATSRAPFGLSGERVHPLGPLPPIHAQQLFTRRAAERRSDVVVANDAIVAALCDRLDGLPLAIELAAARTHVLSVEQIAERLGRRFNLLRSEGVNQPRHRALEGAIAWSCDLLSPAEAALFRSLGAFAGWFDLPAVEAVSDSVDALDLLDRLARQSMIVVDQTAGADARYRLLESLAAYAREWLASSGETADIVRRHADYFRELALTSAAGLRGPDQVECLNRLDRDHDNIIVALDSLIADRDAQHAVELAGALGSYWQRRGIFDEGITRLQAALSLDTSAAPAQRLRAMNAVALLLQWSGRFSETAALLAEVQALARAEGDKIAEATSFDTICLAARNSGRLDEARGAQEQAIKLWIESGDRRGEAVSRMNGGHIHNVLGDHHSAETAYRHAWTLLRGLGDLWAEAAVLANLGEVAGRAGRLRDGVAYLDRALVLARRLQDPERVAILQTNAAEIRLSLDQPEIALELVAEASAQFRSIGNRVQLAGALYVHGYALARTGRRRDGLTYLRESVDLYNQLGDAGDTGLAIECIASLFVGEGEGERAARWLGAAEGLRERDNIDPYPMFDYRGTVTAAKRLISADAFASAWDAGRALPVDDIVFEVLHEGELTDRAPSSGPGSDERALTKRQTEVIQLVAAGRSNREISEQLGISERTVERHLTIVFSVLEADNRSSAVAIATARGLIGSSPGRWPSG